jgi:hypothetical protein
MSASRRQQQSVSRCRCHASCALRPCSRLNATCESHRFSRSSSALGVPLDYGSRRAMRCSGSSARASFRSAPAVHTLKSGVGFDRASEAQREIVLGRRPAYSHQPIFYVEGGSKSTRYELNHRNVVLAYLRRTKINQLLPEMFVWGGWIQVLNERAVHWDIIDSDAFGEYKTLALRTSTLSANALRKWESVPTSACTQSFTLQDSG